MTDTKPTEEEQVFGYEPVIESGIADIIAKTLSDDPASVNIGALMMGANQFVESFIEDISEKSPPPEPLACAKGCSYCCWGYEVQVTAIEVFAIREYLIQNKSEAEIAAILDRLMNVTRDKNDFLVRAADGKLDVKAKLPQFPCALLTEAVCSIYEARPLVCRGFNSYDSKTCQEAKTDPNSSATIKGYVHPMAISQAAFRGVNFGLERVGLPAGVLDLIPALGIALANLDSKERWLAGEDIFEPARTTLDS